MYGQDKQTKQEATRLKSYKDLDFNPLTRLSGKGAKMYFDNGYGISVVEHEFSYGQEVAVLRGTKENWDLCYDTPITDDVIGHQTNDNVTTCMHLIQKLPLRVKSVSQ